MNGLRVSAQNPRCPLPTAVCRGARVCERVCGCVGVGACARLYLEPGRFIHHSVNELARPSGANRITQRLSNN